MLKKVKAKKDSMWSGVVLLVVVGMLVAVYFLKLSYGPDLINVNISPALLSPKSQVKAIENVSLDTYESAFYNFRVDYPKSWQATITSTGEGESEIFSLNLESENNSIGISVMPDEMEGLVRNSISITSESEVEINGTAAKKLEGGSLKDGSPFAIILIKEQDRLYSIEGTGQEFDQVVNYFQLL